MRPTLSPTLISEVDGPTAVIRRAITAADLDAEGHVYGDRDDNGDGTLDERRDISELPDALYAQAMAMVAAETARAA